MDERQFLFNGAVKDFREAIRFLRDTGTLDRRYVGIDRDRLLDTRAPGFVAHFTPQVGDTTFLVVQGQAESWEDVQFHLSQRGWTLEEVRPEAYVTSPVPFVDPSEIKKSSHRRVVQLLIDRHLARNRMTNDEIANAAGVSRSQFYEIRKKYATDERLQKISGPGGE